MIVNQINTLGDSFIYEWYPSQGILCLGNDYLELALASLTRGLIHSFDRAGVTGSDSHRRRLVYAITLINNKSEAFITPVLWIIGRKQEEVKISLVSDLRDARDYLYTSILKGEVGL